MFSHSKPIMAVKAKKEDIEGCKNPEFAEWLWGWYKEAQEKDSRYQFALRKAFDSMVKCEDRLNTGREAARLDGIGPGISDKLQRRLEKYISEGSQWHYSLVNDTMDDSDKMVKPKTASNKPTKPYIPKYKSIAFGIVLALFEKQSVAVKKSELQRLAASHCDKTFEDGAFMTAVKTLISKGIIDYDRPTSSYTLNEFEGIPMASKLWVTTGRPLPEAPTTINTLYEYNYNEERWSRKDFDISILVDVREVKSKTERDAFVEGLANLHIPVSQAQLPLGDILLIAVHKQTREQVCLDVIVERKTDSDLIASITDGRYKEQKQRLHHHCPIRNVVYIIEGTGEGPQISNFGEDRYFAAICQTPVTNQRFRVHRTSTVSDTIAFLKALYEDCCDNYTAGLTVYRGDPLDGKSVQFGWSTPLPVFEQCASKSANLTYAQVFERQLMCVKGVSVEAVRYITSRFKNYPELLRAVDSGLVVTEVKGWDKVCQLFTQ